MRQRWSAPPPANCARLPADNSLTVERAPLHTWVRDNVENTARVLEDLTVVLARTTLDRAESMRVATTLLWLRNSSLERVQFYADPHSFWMIVVSHLTFRPFAMSPLPQSPRGECTTVRLLDVSERVVLCWETVIGVVAPADAERPAMLAKL